MLGGTYVPTCGIETMSGLAPWRWRYGQTVPSLRNIGSAARRGPDHRRVERHALRDRHGVLVAGIGVAHDADRRIVPEHPLDAPRSGRRAVADDHDTRVLRIPHADAAAVMDRNPRGA